MAGQKPRSDSRWNRVGVAMLAIATVLLAMSIGVAVTRPSPVGFPTSAAALVAPKPTKLVVIGDSYTQGTPQGGTAEKSWAALSWGQLRREGADVNLSVAATGGSGYVTPGTNNETFAGDARTALGPDDDMVVVFGGSNDVTAAPDVVSRAVQDTLATVRQEAPRAKVIVVGPVSPYPDPAPDMLQVRDLIRAEALKIGATFVDPIADQWFVGDPSLIGDDEVHPTDAGHAYMSERLLPVLRSVISDHSAAAG